jgi:dTDP-4-amino-4,6-dideoxygalactose transaminase
VEARITPKTRAILPVHLYGQTADMDPLRAIAARHGLRLIEDACQAHGAEYRGRRAGSLGDAAGFSFYYSKNLGAYGEGGFITTSDDDLADKIRKIRDHGSGLRYHHDMIGLNGRLDEIQAVVLRAKLPHLSRWNERRRQLAAHYNHGLKEVPVHLPAVSPGSLPVYHLYVIRTPRRDALQQHLKGLGVSTGIHYPIPIHLQAAMQHLGYQIGDLPVTERVVGEILSLPLYADLSEAEVDYIAQAIAVFHETAPLNSPAAIRPSAVLDGQSPGKSS